MKLKTILCLCAGNYCRSPITEALLRREIERHGNSGQIVVRSAGTTADYQGKPPAPLVVQVATERGGNLDDHHPHLVTPKEVEQADLILAAEQEQVEYIAIHYPEARPRAMLLSRSVGMNADVPDPGVQDINRMNVCADIIETYITHGYREIMRRVVSE